MNTTSAPSLLPTLAGRFRRLLALAAAMGIALSIVLATPTLATESADTAETAETAEGGAQAEEAGGKLTISDNPHDQFGLVLIGLMGIGALAAGINALNQLRGRRPQADGSYRWR